MAASQLGGKCIAQGIDRIKKEVFNHGPVVAPIKVRQEATRLCAKQWQIRDFGRKSVDLS